MVRVISVHNFLKQDISSVDELIDFTTVPPDKLLLVQSDHTILVRDLSEVDDIGYTIPTVDQVSKIIYSIKGNYIGTLERKLTRNGADVCYIRVYLNWESLRQYKEFPPLRARIAGRVTPLSQNLVGLEMIEIPAHNMPDNIACCPVKLFWKSDEAKCLNEKNEKKISGNLMMSSKNILAIYNLNVQMHDISKMYFIDFEQMSVDFLLSFVPSRIQIVENIIAVQNDEFLHVFKLVSKQDICVTPQKEKDISNDTAECLVEPSTQFLEEDKQINYEIISRGNKFSRAGNTLGTSSNCNNYNYDNIGESKHELMKIHNLSFPIRCDFPTIAAFRSSEPIYGDMHKQSPFVSSQDLSVNMISTSLSEDCRYPCSVENILQYQLIPLMLGSSTNREMQEKFTCLILKPFYSSDTDSKSSSQDTKEYGKLKTVACFFGTQQDGYLHTFEYKAANIEGDLGSYVVYPFTAPVVQVALENSFLHALTDSGLETYTMRAAKHLMKTTERMVCPSFDEPVCLIGLRPFVNAYKICITYHNLILFANNGESSNCVWTLYKLSLPNPSLVWEDFLTVAEENRWEAPATYSHLIGEGHLVLKTYLNCIKWVPQLDSQNHLYSPAPFFCKKEKSLAEKLYCESCASLGDFYTMSGDFLKASNYYKMSTFKMGDIVKRNEALWGKVPDKFKRNYDQDVIRKSLIFHLKRTLAFYDDKYATFNGNREEFYSLEIGNIINFLMDYLEKESNLSISDMILDSVVLREFSTDRILKMMKLVLSRSSPPQEKDALSLALMCIQRGQVEQAKTVLSTISAHYLQDLLLKYYRLLFENQNISESGSFTELSMVLIEIYPVVMGIILSYLVTEKHILSVYTLLKIFLEILPSGIVQSRNTSLVLQIVLENYFKFYFERSPSRKQDFKTMEALKILIRIYLTFLKQKTASSVDLYTNNNEQDILFYKYRWNYLKLIPPFASDHSGPDLSSNDSSFDIAIVTELKCVLLKLQCLLCYENIPPECITEVRSFIDKQGKQGNVYGSQSLQILSAVNVQEGFQLLINFEPKAVVQYTKDCLREVDDWKFAVKLIQMKMNAPDSDSTVRFYYQTALSDILLHAAKTLEIEDLVEILPRNFDDVETYLTIAQNNTQANHIKTLIMTTGKQLQTTLYEGIPQKNGNSTLEFCNINHGTSSPVNSNKF